MPFTPTHVLAILPIRLVCKQFSLVALVIGSMIPDFALFYPIVPYDFSHSLGGLLGYCLPSGLLVYYLYELVGKVLIIDFSPMWVKSRIYSYRNIKHEYSVYSILMLSVAVLVGSVSHLVWDAFTHKDAWGVTLLPGLTNPLEFAGMVLPGYKLLQYGSTFIGLPVLAGVILIKLKKLESMISCRFYHVARSWKLFIVASFCLVPAAIAYRNLQQPESFKSIVGQVIKQSIGAGILLFLIYAILYKLFLAKNHR